MEDSFESKIFAVNFRNGRWVDVEVSQPDMFWSALGSGVRLADVWMQGVVGFADLRIHIRRVGSGIEVSIDRGDQSPLWWTQEAAPSLSIAFDSRRRVASATAKIGAAREARAIDLGAIRY